MANNSKVGFSSQNLLSANSDSESSRDHHIGSSSHAPPSPPSPPMRLVIVNVASGCDVMESILDVAQRNQTSLAVQSASGTIASVTFCNIPRGVPAIIVYGPFDILSLTGSYFYDDHYTLLRQATPPPPVSFGIHLSTSHGRVFGGHVGGPVIAYTDVCLTIFTFKNPEIDKYIPKEEESDDDNDDDEDDDDEDDDDNNNTKNGNNDPGNFKNEGDLSAFNSGT